MKRLLIVLLVAGALALGAAATGSAAEGSWGPWEPTDQGPIFAPAGLVCPFPVSAEPLFQNLRQRLHYDDAGNVDGYEVTGPLIGRITNVNTGASRVLNLSGLGIVTFNPDGSYDAIVNGNFLVFFKSGENPSNELLFMSGRTVLHGSPTGVKTLVDQSGRSEDLCQTLA
jgi:hypothetical protein